MNFWKRLFGEKVPSPSAQSGNKVPAPAAPTAEERYTEGTQLYREKQFRNAASVLEDAARLDPKSVAIHEALGAAYSGIAGEQPDDEETRRAWLKKAMGAFAKALSNADWYGGLRADRKVALREMLAAHARIVGSSPDREDGLGDSLLPEEKRKRIYADFHQTIDDELQHTPIVTQIDQIRQTCRNTREFDEHFQRSCRQACSAAVPKIMGKYDISEDQLRSIDVEGKEKMW
jgi:hypothetical protein